MSDATPTPAPFDRKAFDAEYPPKFDPEAKKPRKRVAGPDGKPVACAKCNGTGLSADGESHCDACLGCGHELEAA